jgi:hypothetical protein
LTFQLFTFDYFAFFSGLAIWGLDENGYFLSGYEGSSGVVGQLKQCVDAAHALCRSGGASAAAQTGVAQRVLTDLKSVHTNLLVETRYDETHTRSEKEKGKRLLFLFQRDLLPGVSGKILESKGQRDNIAVQTVSWEAKAAGWAFIGLLNVGMLFYILLFALSQTVHRQGAWALSFLLWLVVEILFVSSAVVVFTHIFIPSLIMKDVNKIKLKLADSIRTFNKSVRTRRRLSTADTITDDPESFNAASYLFVSSRLAQQWPDLREAQIITQFRTPWPKQSYQRETDVSKSYSKKFSALTRSASVIAVFFLTNLLQIPPALQDMVVQMCTTAVLGYTILLHVDLYRFYPLLVVLPALLLVVIVHFVIRSGRANARLKLQRMFGLDKSDADDSDAVTAEADEATPRDSQDLETGSRDSADDELDKVLEHEQTVQRSPPNVQGMFDDSSADEGSDQDEGSVSEGQDDHGELHLPRPTMIRVPRGHMTRKQSTRFGMKVLGKLQKEAQPEGSVESKEDSVDTLISLPVVATLAGNAAHALHSPKRSMHHSLANSTNHSSTSSLTPSEEAALTRTYSTRVNVGDLNTLVNSVHDDSGDVHPRETSEGNVGPNNTCEVGASADAVGVYSYCSTADERELDEDETKRDDNSNSNGSGEEDEGSDAENSDEDEAYKEDGADDEVPSDQHDSHEHGSDGDSESGDSSGLPSAGSDDVEFAQFNAKSTEWAQGVREQTVAAAMEDDSGSLSSEDWSETGSDAASFDQD